MPTIEEQLALRDRLQQIEDRLLSDRKRRIVAPGTHGVFVWAVTGQDGAPLERIEMPELQEIEDTLVAQGSGDFLVGTVHGYFGWGAKRSRETEQN